MSAGKKGLVIEEFYWSMKEASGLDSQPYVFLHTLWLKFFEKQINYAEFKEFVTKNNKRFKIIFKENQNPAVLKQGIGKELDPKQTIKVYESEV